MSEAKRRATRNKAYALGYEAGVAGRELVNPYKKGSGSRADVLYVQGYDDGMHKRPRAFEKDLEVAHEPAPEAVVQSVSSDQ